MQCPKCSLEVPSSANAICGECDYKFGLDPSQPHHLSDAQFLSLVNQASGGGKYYFTQDQLYFYYCAERMPSGAFWPLAGTVGGALGHMALGLEGAAMGAISASVLTHIATKSWRPPPRSALNEVHEQMVAAGHPIKHFISEPLFEYRDEEKYTCHLPRASQIEHVIVVDRNILVDFLVLNDLPKRANALVISHTGYPNYVAPIARELLSKRLSMSIYLLHDSTETRLSMKRSLVDGDVIPTDNHRVFNLGLEPDQVRYMKRLAPLQPARADYRICLDSIPYSYLEAAISYSVRTNSPFLTALAASRFVGAT